MSAHDDDEDFLLLKDEARFLEALPMADTYEFKNATVEHETDKAILVVLADKRQVWFPKSTVTDDSEIWSLKNKGPGTLVVLAWFCEKNGIEP